MLENQSLLSHIAEHQEYVTFVSKVTEIARDISAAAKPGSININKIYDSLKGLIDTIEASQKLIINHNKELMTKAKVAAIMMGDTYDKEN